jgi:hypothetical protein
MRKWVSIFLALAMLAVFSLGCAGISKDAKVKCPKCGAVFTVDEGIAELRRKATNPTPLKEINYPLEERERIKKGRGMLFPF